MTGLGKILMDQIVIHGTIHAGQYLPRYVGFPFFVMTVLGLWRSDLSSGIEDSICGVALFHTDRLSANRAILSRA